jgi:hypothetical protein
MANSIFVSPGVYTREIDLTYVVRQVGVTTLGIAGETPQGPAFEPIFISNYDEYISYFGGLNYEKFKGNNYPKYEANYIAKSYLTQSNQLYVTRILGLSGYEAGPAWAITMNSPALNPTISALTYTDCATGNMLSFTATTGSTNVITNVVYNDPGLSFLAQNGVINYLGTNITTLVAGGTLTISTINFVGTGQTVYQYSASSVTVDNWVSSGGTGCFIGSTFYSQGVQNSGYSGTVLALIRPRGVYDSSEVLHYYVNNLTISATTAQYNPKGIFTLSGTINYGPQSGSSFSYEVSFDTTKTSYITNVLGTTPQNGDAVLFAEEVYTNQLQNFVDNGYALGIKNSLTSYASKFNDYLQGWNTTYSPYVVSEVRGNTIFRLFRVITISDGSAANRLYKFSIINIKPDSKEFDLVVRDFNDFDDSPRVIERWSRLTMDPTSQNFIGRRIGTLNGDYEISSRHIIIEMAENFPEDAFPAGFEGYLQRDYSPTLNPQIAYKQSYTSTELSTSARLSKAYLGISNIVGIDQDFFDYKGQPSSTTFWSGFTHGFHMDINATGCTVENPTIPDYRGSSFGLYTPIFDTGCCAFQTEDGIVGTSYEKLRSRKFTFVPYGGFDGWDEYRTKRTNTPQYVYNGTKANLGLALGIFQNYTTVDGNLGNTSDWYAYYEGFHTFDNPAAVNINVFTTPGITTLDNDNLIEECIDMVEVQRADSIYIVTTPDFDSDGVVYTADEIVSTLDGLYDSNYTTTYWPWIKMNDSENFIQIWLPPTLEVVRNIALTDNIAFPWFATAGVDRGTTTAIRARVRLRQADRDTLYEGRVNPIATFADEGVLIWGNKTLQIADTALNRLNVRRLLLQARKLISAVAVRLLFDPNDQVVRDRFTALVNPILDNIRKERGLYDFRVSVSSDPEEIDRNEMSAKLFLKPTRALEYIIIDFIITPTGASFENI